MTNASTRQPNLFAERLGHLAIGELAEVDDELRATVPPGCLLDRLDMVLTHAGPGAARGTMLVGAHHLNQVGVAQAGAIVALADATAGWAAKTAVGGEATFTTLELNANLLRGVRTGQTLVARAMPVHLGRTTLVIGVDVRVDDSARDGNGATGGGKLVATFRCTELVIT
jgi:uncharacterized protein (TIGR00369 family)